MTLPPESLVAHPVSRVSGETDVPGDKSLSHRALLLGAVARGETRIVGANAGEDVAATARALTALGAPVRSSGSGLVVEGRGGWLEEPENVLDLGNSGTAMRLLTGLLSPQPFMSILTGDASLRSRPMERVAKPLREMGAVILTRRGGRAPIVVAGARLRPIAYEMPSPSAQVKSAILLAALFTPGRTEVREPIPSRDHTERLLGWFGVEVDASPGRASLQGPRIPHGAAVAIPGDPSAAAFFVVAGVLAREGEVVVRRAGTNPTRTGFLDVLRRMGADIEVRPCAEEGPEPMADLIARPSSLRGTVIEPSEVPRLVDEIPILAVAAACAEGTTEIRGAEDLRVKESDRLSAMAAGLSALGVVVEERRDGLTIHGRGPGSLTGGDVESRADHRLAMSFLVAGLSARAPVRVHGTRWIATSDPAFLENLERLAPGAVTSTEGA
jgi:3-phosphoshikimate 1-carboxyvinyltransferase